LECSRAKATGLVKVIPMALLSPIEMAGI
jgi:hypothetical protein